MKKYGPACKEARSLNGFQAEVKIRNLENKCKLAVAPGQHGAAAGTKKKRTGYGEQLLAKQQLRLRYGRIKESQFRTMYKEAARKKGNTAVSLMRSLELRLDNVLYRMGIASTRAEARQLISHKAIQVVRPAKTGNEAMPLINKEMIVTSRSFQTRPGDVVQVRARAKDQERINDALNLGKDRGIPDWLEVDAKNKQGTVKAIPAEDQMPTDVEVQLVIELYSK